MFASEQVMKNYLDQLLTEDTDDLSVSAEFQQTTALEKKEVTAQQAESKYSAKIKQRFSEAEQQDKQNNPQLRPIEKAISADKVRPVKERPKPKDNVHSLEQLLHAVSVQQQEAAKALEEKQRLETALQAQAKAAEKEKIEAKAIEKQKVPEPVVEKQKVRETSQVVEATGVSESTQTVSEDKIEEPFQALFFEVAGLKLAVPLHDLGGIHNLTEVTSLFGKPEWFMGVMVNREKKLNVVESARWVMPEKYNEDLKGQLNYKYLIMLGESNWGFAAEKLVNTQYIKPEEVKWRKQAGKRPWLFGTIKEKMCALLHVEDLIAMLDKGVDARNE